MFELFELFYWLIAVRYMWIGLLAGSLLAATYDRFDPGTSSDVYLVSTLLCGAVGLVLDIRRGLRRTDDDDSIGAKWRRKQ